MNIYWWFLTGVYIMGFLFAWRKFAGAIAWDMKSSYDDYPDASYITFGLIFGILPAVVFPLSLPILYFRESDKNFNINEKIARHVLYTPKKYL